LADVDMTGNFVGFADVFVPVAGCTFDFVQSGTVLSITGDCEPHIGPFTLTGAIDPMTGDFSASGAGSGTCAMFGGVTITATAALDSSRFSGTLVCGAPELSGFVQGFRCGNLQLDPGEACDLGFFDNGAPGSCCSSTCQFEPSTVQCRDGSSCDPAEFCTGASDSCPADVQDPDGTPCTENQGCVSGTCSLGVCAGTAEAAGTLCDLPSQQCAHGECDGAGQCSLAFDDGDPCEDGDACTTNDTCASGSCQGGAPPDCGLCRACDSADGCVPVVDQTCKQPLDAGSPLLIRAKNPSDAKLVWRWTHGAMTAPQDFGDPASTTNYALCVYDTTGTGPRMLVDAAAPAGGKWSSTGSGFRYLDTSASPDGVRKITLRAGADRKAKIIVKGGGSMLDVAPLPAGLPVTAQLKASNGKCWGAPYTSADTSATKLKAKTGP